MECSEGLGLEQKNRAWGKKSYSIEIKIRARDYI